MRRGSFPHTLILTSYLPHTLIRGTHFFEGKITLNPRFVLWLPFRAFYRNDLIFQEISFAFIWTFLYVYCILGIVLPWRCLQGYGRTSALGAENVSLPAIALSTRPWQEPRSGCPDYSIRKKCPCEGKGNFKKSQDISRYFKRVSKKNQSVSSCPDSLFQTPHYNLEILRS